MAITPERSVVDHRDGGRDRSATTPLSRRVYRYDIRRAEFTRLADYHTDVPARFIADAQALDDDRLVGDRA